MSLFPHHQRLVRESAMADEVASDCGYWSATRATELEQWFGRTQMSLLLALVIPFHCVCANESGDRDADGEHVAEPQAIRLERIDDELFPYFADDERPAHPGDGRLAPED